MELYESMHKRMESAFLAKEDRQGSVSSYFKVLGAEVCIL